MFACFAAQSIKLHTSADPSLCQPVNLYSTVRRPPITAKPKDWLQVFNQCCWRCAVDGAAVSMVTSVWHVGKAQQWRVRLLSPKLWWSNETLITHSCDEALSKVCVRAYVHVSQEHLCLRTFSWPPAEWSIDENIERMMFFIWCFTCTAAFLRCHYQFNCVRHLLST